MADSTDDTKKQPLNAIVGEELSSVEFVRDYVRLGFDGPYLTALTWPTVNVGEARYEWRMPGYRDMLCERIGKTVRTASATEDQEIRIEFDDGSIVSISLRPEDYCTAEAAIFHNGPEEWDVW